MEGRGGFPALLEAETIPLDSRVARVTDRLPLEAEAVAGYALSPADEFLVVLRGPEPGYDMDVVSAAQAPVHGVQEGWVNLFASSQLFIMI
jgi:hypothetical protein